MGLFDKFKKKKEDDLLAELEADGTPSESDLGLDLPPFPGEQTPQSRPVEEFPDLPKLPKASPLKELPKITPLPPKVEPKPKLSLFGRKEHEKVFEEEKPLLRKRVVMQTNEPLFVSSKNFRLMLGDLQHLKSLFRDSIDFAVRFDDFEKNRDKHMDAIRRHVEGVQRKIIVTDKLLFK